VSQPQHLVKVAELSSSVDEGYPSPPWRLGGQHWAALFKTERPVRMDLAKSLGAKQIFSHRLGVALLRYTTGTLCYDELIVSVPVRMGWRPCLWIRDIWVSDLRSQSAGINIWNLPKRMATFHWDGDLVTVEDDVGLVAKLNAGPTRTHWPWGVALVPIAGSRNGSWRTATAVWRGRVSFAKPVVESWSDRFEERLVPGSGLGFSSPRFWMTVPDAKSQ
jgi:hypothetical protein